MSAPQTKNNDPSTFMSLFLFFHLTNKPHYLPPLQKYQKSFGGKQKKNENQQEHYNPGEYNYFGL